MLFFPAFGVAFITNANLIVSIFVVNTTIRDYVRNKNNSGCNFRVYFVSSPFAFLIALATSPHNALASGVAKNPR
jgi:hypothetical protein